jgi:hypothetical protein
MHGIWRIASCAVVLAAAGPAAADGVPLHRVTSRTFLTAEPFVDATLGNGWERSDRFTNTSAGPITINAVEFILYDPEDVPATPGFEDIYGHPTNPPTNVGQVVAAAAQANPDYHPSFGANWWPDLDTIEVDWQTASILAPLFPVTLQAGQSFDLTLRAHNSVPGIIFQSVDDYGELVIGFRLVGEVTGGCAGDLDGDGVVGVNDLVALIIAWNQSGNPADLNGDGVVNVQDLVELLLSWGSC